MPSILGANTLSGGFEVANSLRFNDGDSPALTRSLGTTTLATKGTFSFWVKRGQLGTAQMIYTNEVADDNNRGQILFEDDDTFIVKDTVSGSNTTLYKTAQLFRDTSAWYHMVVALDSTQAGGNRIRVYKNGTRIPDAQFGTSTEPNQNTAFKILTGGQTNKNHIGKVHGGSNHFDGYLAEFVYCDGQVLDASSFGEFDEDTPSIWKPISVSGLTMGDQGFYLDFEDSSALGNDKAGSNNFGTVTNLAATDQSTDTCTNNFAVMNPLYVGLNANESLAEGNLKGLNTGNGENNYVSNFGVSSGKWYFEAKANVAGDDYATIGIVATDSILQTNGSWLGSTSDSFFYNENGSIGTNGSASTTGLATYADNDIIGVRVNLDDNELHFYKNGTIITNTALSITANKEYFFGGRVYSNATGWEFNFGSPAYAISSGNADANGYGNFEYSVPSGYYALNSKNLTEFG